MKFANRSDAGRRLAGQLEFGEDGYRQAICLGPVCRSQTTSEVLPSAD
jgi:predicted phosphoribosyltransferase